MPYIHEALPFDEDTIRLLILEPSIEADAKIRCSFRGFAKISNSPRYEAVSYTWGGSHFSRRISINRRSFLIGENLYQCLLRLRQREQSRVLWIDALCIDQTRLGEKGHQIKSIFSTAERVVVWLGEAADGSDELMTYANDRDVFGDPRSQPPDGLPQQINHFFARPYWNRTWVVQELFMAKELAFVCGTQQVGERSFQRFLQEVPTLCPITEREEKILALATHRVPGEGGQYIGTRSLAQLLTEYWNTDCADVRDKIYALLGLLPKYDAARSVPVDYAATRTQLFLRVVDLLDFFTDSSTGAEALAHALELTWPAILTAMRTDAWRGTWFPERYASIRVVARGHPTDIAPFNCQGDSKQEPQFSFSTAGPSSCDEQIWVTACTIQYSDDCYAFEDRKFALLFRCAEDEYPTRYICIGAAWPPVLDYIGPDSDVCDIHALQQYLSDTSRFSLTTIEILKTSREETNIAQIRQVSQRLLATMHAYTTLRQRGGKLFLGFGAGEELLLSEGSPGERREAAPVIARGEMS